MIYLVRYFLSPLQPQMSHMIYSNLWTTLQNAYAVKKDKLIFIYLLLH